jgi:hypothetical protein
MHATSVVFLVLVGAVYTLPTYPLQRRALLTIDPTLSPAIDLSNDNSCLGIGISVCDPITVGDTDSSEDGTSSTTSSTATEEKAVDTGSTSSGSSLIDLSPVISPDIDLSSDDSCTGIGISACDPINVD